MKMCQVMAGDSKWSLLAAHEDLHKQVIGDEDSKWRQEMTTCGDASWKQRNKLMTLNIWKSANYICLRKFVFLDVSINHRWSFEDYSPQATSGKEWLEVHIRDKCDASYHILIFFGLDSLSFVATRLLWLILPRSQKTLQSFDKKIFRDISEKITS